MEPEKASPDLPNMENQVRFSDRVFGSSFRRFLLSKGRKY